MADSIHKEHRKRRRKQFHDNGLDAFEEHEALELLLYFSIPRHDTNELAHRLVKHFGSLSDVFSAPYEELLAFDGVGENTATLLSLIYPLYRKASEGSGQKPVMLNSTQACGTYFINQFRGLRDERMYAACVDTKCKLLSLLLVSKGTVDCVNFNIRAIVERALRCGATGVILAHNHPSGVALPSEEDTAGTVAVLNALRTVGITLLDHIIVAENDYFSLQHNGLLPSP